MYFFFAVILFMSALSLAETGSAWIAVKTQAGIDLSYRYSPDLEVKASAFYPGVPEQFLLLLRDTNSVQRWLSQAKDAQLLDGSTDKHWRVYTRFQAIWPVTPRDMVTCADLFRQDSGLRIQISDCSDLVPETTDYVRIRHITAVWTLTVKAQGFELQYQGSANPGGNLPDWLVKQLTLSSLRSSFIAFKTELKRPNYQANAAEIIH